MSTVSRRLPIEAFVDVELCRQDARWSRVCPLAGYVNRQSQSEASYGGVHRGTQDTIDLAISIDLLRLGGY